MNFIVYKTTNLINGRFYVGVHNGTSKNYFGSGQLLKSAIKKYGKENFIRETLVECDDEEEAYSIELMLVKTVKEDPRSYNIEHGGKGNSNLGKSVVDRGIGIHGASFEDRSNWSKKTQANRSKEDMFNTSSSGGKRCAELGKAGFQTCTSEQRLINAKKAQQTRNDRGFKSPFKDSEIQRQNGIKGGKATAGSRFYTNGNKEFKFFSSNTKDKVLTENEFTVFLQVNKQFSRGRKPLTNNIK